MSGPRRREQAAYKSRSGTPDVSIEESSSDARRNRKRPGNDKLTYTFMPAQNAVDDLWSHVYTIQLRTCFRFGALSSMLVALRILIARSASVRLILAGGERLDYFTSCSVCWRPRAGSYSGGCSLLVDLSPPHATQKVSELEIRNTQGQPDTLSCDSEP